MYLKCSTRRKNGKEHRSWSIVENRRVHGRQSVQRHVLYLGEINDSQQAAWQKSIAVFTEGEAEPLQILVSNDDGYAAEGIDALVEGLEGIDGVEVTVVAPLE